MTFKLPTSPFKELADVMSNAVDEFLRGAQSLVAPFRVYKNGREAVAFTSETGKVEGHICERLTEHSVTIARKNDGVLVTVPRSRIIQLGDREQ